MKILSEQNNIGFKSGLTRQILELEKKTSPAGVKLSLKKSHYKDWGDFHTLEFKKNKAYALACKMCANIFIEFRKKHDYRNRCSMQNLVLPHDLYVFDTEELAEPPKDNIHYFTTVAFFCNDILKNKKPFDPQTILLDNYFSSLEEINEVNDIMRRNNFHSTGHFLHNFVHEWFHAVQGKLLKSMAFNGFGNYEQTYNSYHMQKVSKEENEIVADVLGEYAAIQKPNFPQYSEIFAEAWTKFFCNSLNKECTGFKTDPINKLMRTPKEFREILKKVSTITPVNLFGKVEENKTLTSWNYRWDK